MKNNNKSTVPENLIFTRVSGLIVIKLLSTTFIHLLQNRSIRTSTTSFNQNIYNIVQSEHLQHGSIRISTTWYTVFWSFNQNIYNMVYSVLIVQSEHLQHGSIRTSTTWYTVFWFLSTSTKIILIMAMKPDWFSFMFTIWGQYNM